MSRSRAVVVAVCWFVALSASAEERLADVQAQLSTAGTRLEEAITNHDRVVEELKARRLEESAIVKESKQLLAKVKTGRERVRSIVAEIGAVAAKLDALNQRLDAEEATAMKRLRVIYVHGRLAGLERTVSAEDWGELSKRAYYLTKIKAADDVRLARFRDLRRSHETLITEKSALLAAAGEESRGIEAALAAIDERAKRAKALVVEIERKKKTEERLVAALKGQTAELEKLISRMTEGSLVPSVKPEEATIPLPVPDSVQPPSIPSPVPTVPALEESLSDRRASLVLPISGTVTKSFGAQRGAGLKDAIFSKGIEIRPAKSSEVRSIADGTVIFLGPMPGFGQVLILDHGRREYSLYGRLANVTTMKGAKVDAGQVLAGLDRTKEPLLYFEVRRSGQAFDPRKLFGDRLGK